MGVPKRVPNCPMARLMLPVSSHAKSSKQHSSTTRRRSDLRTIILPRGSQPGAGRFNEAAAIRRGSRSGCAGPRPAACRLQRGRSYSLRITSGTAPTVAGSITLQRGRSQSLRITSGTAHRVAGSVTLQRGRNYSPRITHSRRPGHASMPGFNGAAAIRCGSRSGCAGPRPAACRLQRGRSHSLRITQPPAMSPAGVGQLQRGRSY